MVVGEVAGERRTRKNLGRTRCDWSLFVDEPNIFNEPQDSADSSPGNGGAAWREGGGEKSSKRYRV